MSNTTITAPVNPGDALKQDLVKLYMPMWLRERITATATAILSGGEGTPEEKLQRYLVEQIGGDYLVRWDAEKFHEALVKEWVPEQDRPVFRAGLADLRDRWQCEEEGRPLGQPALKVLPDPRLLDDSPVMIPVPAWIADRLEEIATAADLEGGVYGLIKMEVGSQLTGRNASLMDMVTDTLGNWEFTEVERAATKAAFAVLGEKWEKEDNLHREAEASVEGGVE